MKKQPEITESTRRDFISAFCEYYREKPIEKVTVKEISEKAGYSRVTFYNYFKDPYDLLNQIEEEFILNFTKAIHDNIEQDRLMDNFLYTFDKLINENEMYSQILLTNSHNLQFSTTWLITDGVTLNQTCLRQYLPDFSTVKLLFILLCSTLWKSL